MSQSDNGDHYDDNNNNNEQGLGLLACSCPNSTSTGPCIFSEHSLVLFFPVPCSVAALWIHDLETLWIRTESDFVGFPLFFLLRPDLF
jgi:hypothetical protein